MSHDNAGFLIATLFGLELPRDLCWHSPARPFKSKGDVVRLHIVREANDEF